MTLSLERRRCSRTTFSDIKVVSRTNGQLIGHARDISPYGMFVESKQLLQPGTKILLEFRFPKDVTALKAYSEIKWIKEAQKVRLGDHLGMGVEFKTMFEADKRRLQESIEECSTKINSDNLSLADFVDNSDKDLFYKTKPFSQFMEDIIQKGFDKYRIPLITACKNRVEVFDKNFGEVREMVMMGSCNYLGLSTHPKVVKAALESTRVYGTGSEGAALLSGTYDIHRELEIRLARMKGCEDAAVFPTGYATNVGCISALVKKGDAVIIDRLAHASIIDGCMLSGGFFRSFKHSNIDSLKDVLERTEKKYNGILVVVDGVYSMDGDIAPLDQITEVAHQYGAKVMVDEAHATGVIGERGKGTPSHFKIEGKVDIVMGTLSKALGALGGFVASSSEVVNYLRYYARSGFFSINLPPAVAAAALAAIEVMENETEMHDHLWRNIKYMKGNLQSIGFNVGNTESAIIPIIIGDSLTLRKMSKRIYEEGIFLNAVPYPAVPKGEERFRLSIMATHTKQDLDKTLEVLEKVGREFNILDLDHCRFSSFAA
ncbi:MAG TPA: aminotransferase class I/II-fold pyridoxal phosphate-dependent enzyme [Thermodesulfobacteriota bacterium]